MDFSHADLGRILSRVDADGCFDWRAVKNIFEREVEAFRQMKPYEARAPVTGEPVPPPPMMETDDEPQAVDNIPVSNKFDSLAPMPELVRTPDAERLRELDKPRMPHSWW
ncbi:hypothetical protein JTE90_028247 [Oedothorax gibbosus]|uniref:Uncharacterized protein n=1 Tax=Oedothorax gibbosus TaxID=931172 RepID=A0AAV6URK0_9ARAC|nr:hypothetical protein JTE90_028247 [Oedothorax gibbosus]